MASLDGRNPAAAIKPRDDVIDRAVVVLQRKIAADPRDAKALFRLGEMHRCRGELAAALDAYRRSLALNPEHAAAVWLASILSGDGAPDRSPRGRRPVPFVRMMDFLTPAQQGRLFPVLGERERFRPARVGERGRVNLDARRAFLADGRITNEVRSWFGPKLRGVVPQVLARLRMEEVFAQGRYHIQLSVTACVDGGGQKAHQDDIEQRHGGRKLTFVYYFHREPRRFAGGDLLLYDPNADADDGPAAFAFTRIEPLHNSVVFFPSHALHEITSVECDTRDFADGRFTVNGWLAGARRDRRATPDETERCRAARLVSRSSGSRAAGTRART